MQRPTDNAHGRGDATRELPSAGKTPRRCEPRRAPGTAQHSGAGSSPERAPTRQVPPGHTRQLRRVESECPSRADQGHATIRAMSQAIVAPNPAGGVSKAVLDAVILI